MNAYQSECRKKVRLCNTTTVRRYHCILIDPYQSAAMLSLGEIKSFVLRGKPRSDANSVRGLPCKNKAFYSPETQHGRRVIRVYYHTSVQHSPYDIKGAFD